MSIRSLSFRGSPLWLLGLLAALLVPVLAFVAPASANETASTDWTMSGTGTVPTINAVDGNGNSLPSALQPEDISGVAIGEDGGIYAVDNGLNKVYCLSNVGTDAAPQWEAQTVSGINLAGRDIEGIGWVEDQEFGISWEDRGSGSPSGITELNISGLSATLINHRDLNVVGLNDNSDELHAGGAEGITSLGGGRFAVVQEGFDTGSAVLPTIYNVDANSNALIVDGGTTLLPENANGVLVSGVDAAGVALEPGASNHVWVLSQSDSSARKFVLGGFANSGSQVGGVLDVAMNQPEGMAFTPDGIHMVVVGEPNEIAIFSQTQSQAPLPKGNCEGPQPACPTADMTISPSPAMLGDTITVEVTLQDCDPRFDITRTRIQTWNYANVDWDANGSLIDVYDDIATHTFTGTVIATGNPLMRVNVTQWFAAWNDDGTPTQYPEYDRSLLRERLLIEDLPVPNQDAVQLRNVRTSRLLEVDGERVVTDTEGGGESYWNIVNLANGNVNIVNFQDGTYLDVDNGWVTNVQAVAEAETGSEWILRTFRDGSIYITNADYTAETGTSQTNVRTTYSSRPDTQVRTTNWNSAHTRWFIEPLT